MDIKRLFRIITIREKKRLNQTSLIKPPGVILLFRFGPASLPINVRHKHIFYSKFKHRKKLLNAKGSPKEVIIRVNGQNVYSSKAQGSNFSINTSAPMTPPPPSTQTHNINLHINLTRPVNPSVRQSNQPIIIAPLPKPQPVVAIVPQMASQPAPVQAQPVVVPQVQPQVQPVPTAAPAPPEKKGQSSLRKILLTAALLKTLSGSDSSESATQGFPSLMQNLLAPNSYPPNSLLPGTPGVAALPSMGYPPLGYPQVASQPVGNPSLGYPQANLPVLGFPAQAVPQTGSQSLGYPATAGVRGGVNVAKPGVVGYPAVGTNMGYPAAGNTGVGYPAVGNQNMGYPSVGNPNMGNPAVGNPYLGYPAGGYLQGGVNENVRYPATNNRYLDASKQSSRDPIGGNQNLGYPGGANHNVENPTGRTQNLGFPAAGSQSMDAVETIPNFLSGLAPAPSASPLEVNNPPLPGPSPSVQPNAPPVLVPAPVPSNNLLPANTSPVGTPGGDPNLAQGLGQTATSMTPVVQPNAGVAGTPGVVTGLTPAQGQGTGTVLPATTSADVPGFDPSLCWCGCESTCANPCYLCNSCTDNSYNNIVSQYNPGSVNPSNGRKK
ncbi:hypothetical protein AWC38_SpisGene15887 [Stylophora pistillata]|uniref:Uncharacterized protein n=1 Tax=Stylophora pistillata TaxID=50429 RepID=A0A2B4RR91_STYPI|nr:hypothetical protein AWC38_SpisGene15887 [Stylophora pistillata]